MIDRIDLLENEMSPESSDIEEIYILIFDMMGIGFGIDMEMIAEMCEPDQAKERKINLFYIHENLQFHTDQIHYRSPKVLIVKDEALTTGIVIDGPESINVPVKIEEILPKPSLMEAMNLSSPIWGVTIINNEIILLIDPFKLVKMSHSNSMLPVAVDV